MVEFNKDEFSLGLNQEIMNFIVGKKDIESISNLAHYTSVNGFFGIINNQKFRMSAFDYMNDPNEVSFYMGVFCKAFKDFYANRVFNLDASVEFLVDYRSRKAHHEAHLEDELEGGENSILEEMEWHFDGYQDFGNYFDCVLVYFTNALMNEKMFCEHMSINADGSRDFDCYIGCFCDASVDSEILPLWNLYANQGRGVRMEWIASDFIKSLKEQNDDISFHSVEYFDIDELLLITKRLLGDLEELFIDFSGKFPETCRSDAVLRRIGNSLCEMVIKNSIVIKKKEYGYEKEFRVIMLQRAERDVKKKHIYEVKGDYIHRYLEINFPAEILNSVICGPVSDARSLGSIRRYLSSADISRRFALNKKHEVDVNMIRDVCEKINKIESNYNWDFIQVIIDKGVDDIKLIFKYLSDEAVSIFHALESQIGYVNIHVLPIPEFDLINECNDYIRSKGGVVICKKIGYSWWYPECREDYLDCWLECNDVCRLSSGLIPSVQESNIKFRI